MTELSHLLGDWLSELSQKCKCVLLKVVEDYILETLQDVTDLINRIVQVLRRDLYRVRISAQDAELMEPVEPWDEG